MQQAIDRFVDTFADAWHGADLERGPDGEAFTASEQSRHERELVAFVDVLSDESRRGRRGAIRAEAEPRILGAFRTFAASALGWQQSHLDALLSDGFRPALQAFPAAARRFDPEISPAAIYQAARNAITMHCLQRLLGVPVAATPSTLAYSLLYPYTDDYLDDLSVGVEEKRVFGSRLARRLAGATLEPIGWHERQVFRLVGMIEGQFERKAYPDIFAGLLAIHAAQQRSLLLLHASPPLTPREVVRISLEKGGASVLTDGYLVAGTLSPAQAECLFGLGVFLQLRDDLEDVGDDRASGLRTVFSSVDGPLDEPVARALAVGRAVLDRLECFPSPSAAAVRALMVSSLGLVLTDAAASSPARFSAGYLAKLEAHSPVRLESLTAQRLRVSRARGSLTSLLETWIGSAPDEPGGVGKGVGTDFGSSRRTMTDL
jgi:hypothetical protein